MISDSQQPNDLGVALAALMRLPTGDLARIKAESLLRLARSLQTEQRRFLLAECVQRYLALPDDNSVREFEKLLKQDRFSEVKDMAVTWFDQGLEKGLQKGLEQGLEQGLEKGLEKGLDKGRRDLLQVQLEERFGPLRPEVQERLDGWPADRLMDLARQLVHAKSLEELGLQ